MSDADIVRILTESFSRLRRDQKKRLRKHIDKGTRIFCGPGSKNAFVSKDGYG